MKWIWCLKNLALLGLFWSALYELPCNAAEPGACALGEDMVVCELKIERNNAMDELALNAAMVRRQAKTAENLATYWKDYVAGINAQAEWWRSYAEGVAKNEKRHVW